MADRTHTVVIRMVDYIYPNLEAEDDEHACEIALGAFMDAGHESARYTASVDTRAVRKVFTPNGKTDFVFVD